MLTHEKPTLSQRLAMNEAFWRRGPASRPLIGMAVNITFPAVRFAGHALEQGRVTPDMIDPDWFLQDWDRSYEHTESRGEDLFMVASPFAGIPWMEVIAGCQVFSSPKSGSIWAEHPSPDWDSLDRVGFDPDNPWFLKLVECSRVLVEHARGRYPVGNPILRGITDIVAALLGSQRMVFEFFDHPQQLQQLLVRCTQIWQGVGEALVRTFGLFHGGQCPGRRRVWTPGTCMLYQDDAVAVLSPELYRQYILPLEHEVLRHYDRTMIHTHSATLPILIDGLLSLDSLHAIEVLIDPTGPSIPELIPTFRRILDQKALLICGEISLSDIELLVKALPAQGLCLMPKVNTEAQADALFGQILSMCQE
ncbi:hypothetical protein [Fontivita pretiosa]|uniref:hypothetical protein n=1 Tax=Fontivita pretiosa TaxID=2989684 RepID=UPI003D176FA5